MDGVMLHYKGNGTGDDQSPDSILFALHLEDKATHAISQSKLYVSKYDDPMGSTLVWV
jgi:hypothetical protein